jgi:hypothetical protein
MSNSRICRTLLLAVAGTAAIALTGGPAYAAGSISANPNHGVPTSTFTLTFTGFTDCDTANDQSVPCIDIDFIQGARVTSLGHADSNGAATFSGPLQVPPRCTATRTTLCSDIGGAIIRAHSSKGDDASTTFTVDNPSAPTTAAPTTTVAPTTTSSSSTSTSTSSTSTSTSTSSSTTSTTEFVTTTTERALKKSSSDDNDDIPRYIAVALVVAAAAATAAVDTRLRRMA